MDSADRILDPEALIQTALDANLDAGVFEIDDGDVPQAPNSIEWVMGATYMNSSLFTVQAEQLVKLFADFCPNCSDLAYLKDVPVEDSTGMSEFRSRVQLLEHGLCPKCKQNRIELFDIVPRELVAVWGQRSGKSTHVASQIATYQLHRYLKIPNTSRYFEQSSGQQFDITFVALTSRQAQSSLWSKFYGSFWASPWFKDYNKFLDGKAQEAGIKSDHLYKHMDTYVWYGGTKNLLATFQASNARNLRGDTRIMATIDELGHFGVKGTEVMANAHETYASLNNSLRTIRSMARAKWAKGDYNSPTALMANISSPSSVWDAIMQKLREGERDPTKVCSHKATWDVNPQITRADFRVEEQTNPIAFARDFKAEPPLGADQFLGSEKNLERVQDKHLKSLFKFKVIYVRDEAGYGRYVAAQLLENTLKPDKGTPRLISVDTGESQNSFAIGVYSLFFKEGETESTIVNVDQVVEVMPEQHTVSDENVPVHFPTMERFLMQLTERLNVKYVIWDRWQSTSDIQRLREKKIKSERYSPKWEDFLNLRSRIWAGTIKAPVPEMKDLTQFDLTDRHEIQTKPWTHFYVQLATVREIGRKVAKPVGGEDDMFRTLVLATSYFDDPKIRKEFMYSGQRRGTQQAGRMMGVCLQRGGGSAGTGGSLGAQRVGLIRSRNG